MDEKKPEGAQELSDSQLEGASGGMLRAARSRCAATEPTTENAGGTFPPAEATEAEVVGMDVSRASLLSN